MGLRLCFWRMRRGISYLDISEDGVVCSLGSPAVLLEDEEGDILPGYI
jgi:hypothetical protein